MKVAILAEPVLPSALDVSAVPLPLTLVTARPSYVPCSAAYRAFGLAFSEAYTASELLPNGASASSVSSLLVCAIGISMEPAALLRPLDAKKDILVSTC